MNNNLKTSAIGIETESENDAVVPEQSAPYHHA